MSEHQLIKGAEQGRVRARAAATPESDLNTAESFEAIASIAEARRAVEETRCW